MPYTYHDYKTLKIFAKSFDLWLFVKIFYKGFNE